MDFTAVYYEPGILQYELGKKLKSAYQAIPWYPIENHNRIRVLSERENKDFPQMKRYLIVGTRKTHRYVENQKISDYLVPFTSSGCTAMCLYCYLVCNYNKCAYLRIFVNREEMLERLIRFSNKVPEPGVFEVGSNSDLILENQITGNLPWLISDFGLKGRGKITFPTKFHQVDDLLELDHKGKTIFRMSVNPEEIIKRVEFGTSSLEKRLEAVNKMCDAGYPVGILIAPVILLDGWNQMYEKLLDILSEKLSPKTKKQLTVEVILMTYSFVHRAINAEAFPNAVDLYSKEQMVGRGRGKYAYRLEFREEAQDYLRNLIQTRLPEADIVYFS